MSETDKYAVFGNPIKHSKSPLIHAAFANQFGHRVEYRAVRVERGDFERSARAFFDRGGAGLNVTVPFKPEAAAFADRLRPDAAAAVAAPTRAVALRSIDGVGVNAAAGISSA